jgi:hypothetical protein
MYISNYVRILIVLYSAKSPTLGFLTWKNLILCDHTKYHKAALID